MWLADSPKSHRMIMATNQVNEEEVAMQFFANLLDCRGNGYGRCYQG
jgi:hypothetical protein